MGKLRNYFLNHYPRTDFHELNQDWMISMLYDMINQVENFVELNAVKYANPIQWDITASYEKNTIVIDGQTGVAYMSVKPVPIGVALNRTEYWTVVFDLWSFVVRTSKNFSSRYESETTLTATFPSNEGDWLVWSDTLYVALTNITAGDSYVINGNIKRVTLENVVGHLPDLVTTENSNIVSAINSEHDERVTSDEEINTIIGDLDDLETSVKTNIVSAINSEHSERVASDEEIKTIIGNLDDLETPNTNNLVDAINSQMQRRYSYGAQIIYVDGVNGTDDNDGSVNNPVATFTRALDLQQSGFNDQYVTFLTGGNYSTNYRVYSGTNIHILNSSGDTVTITINSGSNIIFYNTYIHFEGSVDAPIIINHTAPIMYFDHSTVTATYTTFNNDTRAYSGTFDAANCTFTLRTRIYVADCTLNNCTLNSGLDTNNTNITLTSCSIRYFNADNSSVVIKTGVNINTYSATAIPINMLGSRLSMRGNVIITLNTGEYVPTTPFISATGSSIHLDCICDGDTVTNKYTYFLRASNSAVTLKATDYNKFANVLNNYSNCAVKNNILHRGSGVVTTSHSARDMKCIAWATNTTSLAVTLPIQCDDNVTATITGSVTVFDETGNRIIDEDMTRFTYTLYPNVWYTNMNITGMSGLTQYKMYLVSISSWTITTN